MQIKISEPSEQLKVGYVSIVVGTEFCIGYSHKNHPFLQAFIKLAGRFYMCPHLCCVQDVIVVYSFPVIIAKAIPLYSARDSILIPYFSLLCRRFHIYTFIFFDVSGTYSTHWTKTISHFIFILDMSRLTQVHANVSKSLLCRWLAFILLHAPTLCNTAYFTTLLWYYTSPPHGADMKRGLKIRLVLFDSHSITGSLRSTVIGHVRRPIAICVLTVQ